MCENEKKKTSSIEMTSGSLWKNILLFSLPLMGSQVLEVLFNLSDVAVVGRFADYMALGAVGSTTLLVTLFTGILIGMGAGVNVRVAHELGAENRKGTEETIHTSLLLCAIAGLLVCVVCLLFSGQMLSMMNTKPELMDQAVLYMKIYALGMPAMAVYNFGNGVLSARGDTKRPLIYLSIAGVINVLLNLFFVIVCHMAATGVATASAIALAAYGAIGAGLPPYEIKKVVTVCKAYSSAVGAGAFVSEIFGEEADELRKRGGDGGEFGATTGRPRRMGWFDCVASKYGCRLQGATDVAFTVLDVLGYLDEIPVCTGYEIDGEVTTEFPTTVQLEKAKPVIEKLPGWKCDIRGIKKYEDLPENCRKYVEFVEKHIGFPITMISNGPGRSDIIYR